MADKSNLQARMDSLEKKLSDASRGGRLGRFWAFLGFLLVCGLLSGNLWMISQQVKTLSVSDKEHAFWVVCHSKSSTARKQAFLKLVDLGNTEWLSARLNDLNLKGVKLRGVNLSGADFGESDLSGAKLAKASLVGSLFRLSDLSGADLSSVDAARADFFKADLKGSNFRGASLQGASMDQADGREVKLVMASLADGYLPMVNFTKADLTGVDFTGADLESAVLREANLTFARFSNANLRDVDLTDSNWWRARGLTTAQIVHFQNLFPPSQDGDSSRLKDYELWLESNQKTSTPDP